MKTAIISYSFTGNNDALAESIASKIRAKHIKLKEPKQRGNFKIALDMLFNRTPKVTPMIKDCDKDLVIFMAPVWMGRVASPLRGCMKNLEGKLDRYAFISISGGADGDNPKLARELKKRLGKEPTALIDMHIADLIKSDKGPTRKETSNYSLTDKDVEYLTGKILKRLKENTAI